MMERHQEQVLQYMSEVEQKAEEILTERQHIIDLDRRRQKTREAIRALKTENSSKKEWMCFGNMFIKVPQRQAKKMLQKDFDNLNTEIDESQKKLKPLVNQLRDLEQKEELKGFNLQALSREETMALSQLTR